MSGEPITRPAAPLLIVRVTSPRQVRLPSWRTVQARQPFALPLPTSIQPCGCVQDGCPCFVLSNSCSCHRTVSIRGAGRCPCAFRRLLPTRQRCEEAPDARPAEAGHEITEPRRVACRVLALGRIAPTPRRSRRNSTLASGSCCETAGYPSDASGVARCRGHSSGR